MSGEWYRLSWASSFFIIVKNSCLCYDESLIHLHETVSKLIHTISINKSIINLFHVTNMANYLCIKKQKKFLHTAAYFIYRMSIDCASDRPNNSSVLLHSVTLYSYRLLYRSRFLTSVIPYLYWPEYLWQYVYFGNRKVKDGSYQSN
jgi:hypothetical protein